jgi:hypothetical protein
MTNIAKKFSHNAATRDFFELFVGEKLGEGCYRTVYRHKLDRNLVIKFETGAHCFANIREWEVWNRVECTDHARWFAPCKWISASGVVLIQDRTKKITGDDLPHQVPTYFSDIKPANWGRLKNGEVVCHDYGQHLLIERGLTKRLKRVTKYERSRGHSST